MGDTFKYIIDMLVALPIILILIIVSIRLARFNLLNIENTRYTKVLEKIIISKDTQISILKMGDEGLILASSPYKIEKIKELSKEEINIIEEKIKQNKINKDNFKFDLKNIKKYRGD